MQGLSATTLVPVKSPKDAVDLLVGGEAKPGEKSFYDQLIAKWIPR